MGSEVRGSWHLTNRMLGRIVIVSILAAGPALACRVVSSPSPAALAREDRAEQREIVRALANEAEVIYIGIAVNEAQYAERAEFKIIQVLKGAAPASPTLTFEEPNEYTVGCTGASGFRNIIVDVGETYLIYVAGGRLLRTGLKARERYEISWSEEIKILRRSIAHKESRERTRGG